MDDLTNDEERPVQMESVVVIPDNASTPMEAEAQSLTVPEPQPEASNGDAVTSLDPEILNLLGEDPADKKSHGEGLHKDIAPRWAHILTNGLQKETVADLLKLYLPPENCTNICAPKLNPEIKAALSDLNVKQDLYSQNKQNQLGSGLTALGQVLNWALTSNNIVPPEIIKTLSNAGRLFCDNHYRESLSRRYAILNALNRNIRDTIKDTKINENLFGSDLANHLKSSKAITKTASEMKPRPRPPYRTPVVGQPQRGTLNSRGTPRAAATEPRTAPAPRRPPPPPPPPPRDNRQATARGRQRHTGYSRQQTRRR